jgi:glycosyltransferase involved in cell wall biosynthesis
VVNIHLYPSPFRHESRILREAATLRRLGLFDRIELIGVGEAGLAREEQVEEGVRIRRIGGRRDGGLPAKVSGALNWAWQIYREYRNAPLACINCHSVATLPLGCALKRATGARLIYDAHELETETSGLRGVRKRVTKAVESALISHVDHAIFVGGAIEVWYRRRYGLETSSVVYNCPRLSAVTPSDCYRRAFPIAPEMPVFLYQGVISEQRGIPKLVEAFAGLEDRAALVVMGYGDLVPWLLERVKHQPNLFYHAAVPPERLLAYTAGADYGLSVIEPTCLSYEFCLPNKLFEYIMADKPVLVSPTTEQRSLVERYGIGEVAADTTPKSIRAAVDRLLATDPGQLKMALERARRDFCWERQEETLRRIYCDALGFQPRIDRLALEMTP